PQGIGQELQADRSWGALLGESAIDAEYKVVDGFQAFAEAGLDLVLLAEYLPGVGLGLAPLRVGFLALVLGPLALFLGDFALALGPPTLLVGSLALELGVSQGRLQQAGSPPAAHGQAERSEDADGHQGRHGRPPSHPLERPLQPTRRPGTNR